MFYLVLHLLMVHSPDGLVIEINPHEISSIRQPPSVAGHFDKDVHCLIIMTNGKFIATSEDCQTVVNRFEEALKE